jgi:hypothetical protein
MQKMLPMKNDIDWLDGYLRGIYDAQEPFFDFEKVMDMVNKKMDKLEKSKNTPNFFVRLSQLDKQIRTPKLLAEELRKKNCFVDVPDNAQEIYASHIENVLDDNKSRYLIAHSVYTDDDCLLATVLFLEGKKIVKIAKVRVD